MTNWFGRTLGMLFVFAAFNLAVAPFKADKNYFFKGKITYHPTEMCVVPKEAEVVADIVPFYYKIISDGAVKGRYSVQMTPCGGETYTFPHTIDVDPHTFYVDSISYTKKIALVHYCTNGDQVSQYALLTEDGFKELNAPKKKFAVQKVSLIVSDERTIVTYRTHENETEVMYLNIIPRDSEPFDKKLNASNVDTSYYGLVIPVRNTQQSLFLPYTSNYFTDPNIKIEDAEGYREGWLQADLSDLANMAIYFTSYIDPGYTVPAYKTQMHNSFTSFEVEGLVCRTVQGDSSGKHVAYCTDGYKIGLYEVDFEEGVDLSMFADYSDFSMYRWTRTNPIIDVDKPLHPFFGSINGTDYTYYYGQFSLETRELDEISFDSRVDIYPNGSVLNITSLVKADQYCWPIPHNGTVYCRATRFKDDTGCKAHFWQLHYFKKGDEEHPMIVDVCATAILQDGPQYIYTVQQDENEWNYVTLERITVATGEVEELEGVSDFPKRKIQRLIMSDMDRRYCIFNIGDERSMDYALINFDKGFTKPFTAGFIIPSDNIMIRAGTRNGRTRILERDSPFFTKPKMRLTAVKPSDKNDDFEDALNWLARYYATMIEHGGLKVHYQTPGFAKPVQYSLDMTQNGVTIGGYRTNEAIRANNDTSEPYHIIGPITEPDAMGHQIFNVTEYVVHLPQVSAESKAEDIWLRTGYNDCRLRYKEGDCEYIQLCTITVTPNAYLMTPGWMEAAYGPDVVAPGEDETQEEGKEDDDEDYDEDEYEYEYEYDENYDDDDEDDESDDE